MGQNKPTKQTSKTSNQVGEKRPSFEDTKAWIIDKLKYSTELYESTDGMKTTFNNFEYQFQGNKSIIKYSHKSIASTQNESGTEICETTNSIEIKDIGNIYLKGPGGVWRQHI